MSAPLPPGWQEMRAGDKVYYIDHNTKTTSWVRPVAQAPPAFRPPPPPPPPSEERMPPGWEKKQAPDGRSFYVNHNTHTTSWESPVKQQQAYNAPPPPPPVMATAYNGGARPPPVPPRPQAVMATAYNGAAAPPPVPPRPPMATAYNGSAARPPAVMAQVYNPNNPAARPVQAQVYNPNSAARPQAVVAKVYNPNSGARPVVAQAYNNQPVSSGKRKAVLVGCNYRGSSAALNGCINDVKNMKDMLSSQGFNEMIVLTDDLSDQKKLPTRVNIVAALKWLVKDSRSGDSYFFHFSGHGAQQEDTGGDEADGYDETIVPCDFKRAGQITDDELWKILVEPLAEGCRLTSVMDCCHSGTGLDLPFIYTQSRGWECDDCPAFSRGDVQLFSGCEDDQCSADTMQNFKAGGAMTNAFLKALKDNPMPLYPEFMAALHRGLKSRGYKQKPMLTSSQRFGLADRVFSLTEGFVSNSNAQLGRVVNPNAPKRRKKKGRGRMAGMGGGGGLEGMLALGLGAAVFSTFF